MDRPEDVKIIDDVTFRKEVPSAEIRPVDAKFYAFSRATLDGVFQRNFNNESVRPLSRLRPGWGPDSSCRQKMPVADKIGPWEMLYYTFSPDAIAPHLSDFTIDAQRASWYPYVSASHLGLIVTEDVRAVIEDLDPNGNYFFPMQIRITETGDPLPGNRFYWKPRREMVFTTWSPTPNANPEHRSCFPPASYFSDRQVAWQFTFNEPLRDFLSQVPFWTCGPHNNSFAMSPHAFQRLKSERFTGLLEFTSDDYDSPDFDHSHNVGYF